MKKLLSLSVLIAMFAFIGCTEWRDSEDDNSEQKNTNTTVQETTYTVTFFANDETNKSYTQTFVSGESQLLNENCFTRTGYNFAGWNTKRNGYGTAYTDRARLTATCDITLYAQWIYVGSQDTPDNPVKTYTVTFHSNDGTNKSYTQTFINGQSQNLNVNCFVRTGYTFAGWNTNADGYGTSYTDKRAITIYSDKILYAQWTYIGNEDEPDPNPNPNPNPDNPVKTYTVTYTTEYAVAPSDVGGLKKGDTLIAEQLPELITDGYTFAGWYNGETKIEAGYTITGDLNLTAKWTVNTNTAYTVEHYQQNISDAGYTLVNADTENKTGVTNENTTATAKDYAGFTAKTVEQMKIAADGSTIIKIYYDRNTITLTLNLDGGEGDESISGKYEEAVTTPANPTKTGYTFASWNPALPATLTGNATYTATWTANKAGISVILPKDAEINLQQVTNENTVTFTAADGFGSYAWYIDGEKQSETSTTFAIDTSTMKPANYKVMVIVADGDEYYSATADLEIKRVQ